MHADQAQDPKLLAHYEGLIRKTAALYVDQCEEDYEDICQLFRIKVWKALLYFEPARVVKNSSLPEDKQRDRFVFACVLNQAKDLTKRVKRNLLYIEDFDTPGGFSAEAGHRTSGMDHFQERYLKATEEQVFGVVQEGAPLIPSSLTDQERRVIALLYLDFTNYGEIASDLGVPRKEVGTLVKSIRAKMADWRPTAGESATITAASADATLPLAA